MDKKDSSCPECHGTGIVYVKFQGFRTCWKCLHAHKLDQDNQLNQRR